MQLILAFFVIGLLLLHAKVQAMPLSTEQQKIAQLEQFAHSNPLSLDFRLDLDIQTFIKKNIMDTTNQYIQLYKTTAEPNKQQLLSILSKGINQIDPNSLDTVDREHVATIYENFLDLLELESSEGILNTWMYGAEINDLIEHQQNSQD